MNNEIIKSVSDNKKGEGHVVYTRGALDQEQVTALYKKRFLELSSLKNELSLKLFHQVEEKLLTEKKTLEKLLNLQNAEDAVRARYSNVLSTYFFDQKFFGER
ncbi:MAG: hypothetical protein JNN11_01210 [Candidatus Doudnabacteria bacterium]|nr:hypothetical protein [Candidatus Doudnabacteria bacterium]